MGALHELGRTQLLDLAHALATGRLRPPYTETSVGRYASGGARRLAATELRRLAARGMGPEQIAVALELLGEEQRATQEARDRVELVWTDAPERRAPGARTTSAVVRSLFETAERSVIVVSYALDDGDKGRALLGPLLDRLEECPELDVRLLLNVIRERGDAREDEELLRKQAEKIASLWGDAPRPSVFYDPRAFIRKRGPRACLHAKCVIVDDARALVTSANFTEAAHERNVEAGVLVGDTGFVTALRRRFEGLIRNGAVLPVPGLQCRK